MPSINIDFKDIDAFSYGGKGLLLDFVDFIDNSISIEPARCDVGSGKGMCGNLLIITCISIFGIVGVVPIRQILWGGIKLARYLFRIMLMMILFAIMTFTLKVAFRVSNILFGRSLVDLIADFISSILLLVILEVILCYSLYSIAMFLRDAWLYYRSTRMFEPDRRLIGKSFQDFRTPFVRSRYVEWLDRKSAEFSEHIEHLRRPDNV